jgi:hypothetical protein
MKNAGRTLLIGLLIAAASTLQAGIGSAILARDPAPTLILGTVLAAAICLRPGTAALAALAGAVIWSSLASSNAMTTALALVIPAAVIPIFSGLRERPSRAEAFLIAILAAAAAQGIRLALEPPAESSAWIWAAAAAAAAGLAAAVMYPLCRAILRPEVV